jgi:hypothetical protein
MKGFEEPRKNYGRGLERESIGAYFLFINNYRERDCSSPVTTGSKYISFYHLFTGIMVKVIGEHLQKTLYILPKC